MKILPSCRVCPLTGVLMAVLIFAWFSPTASAVITTWTASDSLYTNTRITNLVTESTPPNRILVGSAYYGYVRFDTGSTYSNLNDIESAVLRIYLPYSMSNGSSTVSAINILDSWEEDNWNPEVGEAFTPSIGSLSSGTAVNGTTNPGIYWEWDVTSLVKSSDAGLGNNIMSFRLDSSQTIRFAGLDHASGFYPQLVVTAVPEPRSWALLGLGLTALVVFRRRPQRDSLVS
jgi:hypothetical protein